MSDDKRTASPGTNTRWWESYLVRYLSGAIVGAICLMVMLLYADWRLYNSAHIGFVFGTQVQATAVSPGVAQMPPSGGLQSVSMAAVVFMLVAGGLVYSYIISAPITVIHFGRSGRSSVERHVRYFWLGWVVALAVLQAVLLTVGLPNIQCSFITWLALFVGSIIYLLRSSTAEVAHTVVDRQGRVVPIGRKRQRSRENQRTVLSALAWGVLLLSLVMGASGLFGLKARPAVVSLMTFALPTIFVGGMQYVTLFRIFKTEVALHRFYRLLTRARTMDNSKDVRETYTHLREHSNATFIVLLELCFSAFLIVCIEVFAGQSVGSSSTAAVVESERLVNAVLLLIAFWMTPNLFMWSRANQLERDFADRPMLYAARAIPALKADPQARLKVSKRSR